MGITGVIRFGGFELDPLAEQLSKRGLPLRLQPKPLQALTVLLERPGQIVSREELRQRLWGADTFVEFDDGLNHAIKKLRDVLEDSADHPRFIETLPGRGYRFIRQVEVVEPPVGSRGPEPDPRGTGDQAGFRPGGGRAPASRVSVGRRRALLRAAALLAACGFVGLAVWVILPPANAPLAPPSATAKPAVAVLPLANLSRDPAQDYFADAMTEALIGELAKIAALRVISRTSTMRYRQSDKGLLEIARELKVSHVVEGSVLHVGDQVRITAQLIEGDQDRHLWSESYERGLGDILALQGEVARAIAKAIQVELTPEEEVRLAAAHPVRPEVYKTYLEGRSLFERGNTHEGIEHFQRTIEQDPDYAAAYSWLADGYTTLGWWTGPPIEMLPKAKMAALKARQLDPTLAEPYLLLGKIRAHYEWDWVDAEKYFQRALELNPNHVRAYLGYANYLAIMGRRQTAIEMARRAEDLDPLTASTIGLAGDIYYFAREYERAIQHYRTAREMQPNGALWHAMLGCIYTDTGRYKEARASLQRSIPLAGEDLRPKALLGWSYARSGNRTKAPQVLDELERASAPTHGSRYSRAFVYAALGDLDRAFAMLDQAVQARWPFLGAVTVLPPYDGVRSDPRYAELLKKIGLESRVGAGSN